MKRIFVFLLIVILMISVFGCNEEQNKKTYQVYEIGGSGFVSGAKHVSEIVLNDETYIDKDVLEDKIIKFNDREFNATYVHSVRNAMNGLVRDYYETVDPKIEFGFERETGDEIYFHYYVTNNYLDTVEGEKLDRDACYNIALNYLKLRQPDSSSYKLQYENFMDRAFGGVHFFEFTHSASSINAIISTVRINVTVYGDVVVYMITPHSDTNRSKILTTEAINSIEKSIDDKINKIYENINDKYRISYEIKTTYLHTMANDKSCMDYHIIVTLEDIIDTKNIIVEPTRLLVYLE